MAAEEKELDLTEYISKHLGETKSSNVVFLGTRTTPKRKTQSVLERKTEDLVREVKSLEEIRDLIFWIEFHLYESFGPAATEKLKEEVLSLNKED